MSLLEQIRDYIQSGETTKERLGLEIEHFVVDERGVQIEFDKISNLIEKTAKENGMLTLEQKGVLAVLRGETTLEEISRVI